MAWSDVPLGRGVFDQPSVQFRPVLFPDRASRRLSLVAIAATLALILPARAAAHTELETATPAAGSTVPSPFNGPILLTFSEELAVGSKADLLGPGGDVVASATVDGPTAAMSFELDAPLDPGDYVTEWTGVAVDGHVERDTVAFTVAPAPPTQAPSPTPTPEPAASATPTAPSAEPTASATPPPTPTPAETTGTSGDSDVVLPIVVVLLVVAVGTAYPLSRRGRPTL